MREVHNEKPSGLAGLVGDTEQYAGKNVSVEDGIRPARLRAHYGGSAMLRRRPEPEVPPLAARAANPFPQTRPPTTTWRPFRRMG